MTIRFKLLLFFLIQHFIFFIVAVFIYEFLMIPHSNKMDREAAFDKLKQIKNVIRSEVEHLDLLNKDWSVWDDSYAFIQDKNEQYRQSNLVPTLLDDIKVNTIAYFDTSDALVYIKDDGHIPRSSFMDASGHVLNAILGLKQYERGGIIALDGHYGVLSVHDIQSNGDNPDEPKGTLVMIRDVDHHLVERINKGVNVQISLAQASVDFQRVDENYYAKVVDDEQMLIGTYLQGFADDEKVFATIPFTRHQLIENKKLMVNVLIVSSVFGIVSLIISVVLLQHNVIAPLMRLGRHITRLRQKNRYDKSSLSRRNDEIGLIVKEFNHLIHTIKENHEMIERVSRVDALTGLANRMDLNEHLDKERREACRHRMDVSILMLDIDYFKNYNDTYSHVKGDEVLQRVADAIKQAGLRPRDYVARYGGEEFMVVLPKTHVDGSVIVAKRIMKNIEALQIEHASSGLEKKIISVSIGCLSLTPKKSQTIEEIINQADEALYAAKENGRDQYFLYRDIVT